MSDNQKQEPSKIPAAQIMRVVFGIIAFAALMGMRDEFHSVWVRALIAGCAGCVLGILVLPLQKNRG